VCAACRLLNQYLLDGGVFNVLQGYLNLITVANFAAPAEKMVAYTDFLQNHC